MSKIIWEEAKHVQILTIMNIAKIHKLIPTRLHTGICEQTEFQT